MKQVAYCVLVIAVVGLISFFVIEESNSNIAETATFEESTEEEITSIIAEETTSITECELTTEEFKSEESVTTETEPEKNYTDEDIYLLAQIIFCEAGKCSKAEMANVGQVVINRLETDYWEFSNCDTIYEVLCYKNSYPATLRKIKRGVIPSQEALLIAKELLSGELDSGLSEEVLWQTAFKPSWRATVVLKTNWHYYSVPA